MRTEIGAFTGIGGYELYYRGWLPEGDPRARVFVAHGLNEHGGRYAHVAAALAARGLAVWAHDYQGHGRSEGVCAYVDRFDVYVEDFVTFIDRTPSPGKTFVYGHSMGGAVALRLAERFADRLDGLVVSGTALLAGAFLPKWSVAIASLLSTLTPRWRVKALPAGNLSHDPAVQAAVDRDPRCYTGKVTARMGAETLRTMAHLLANLEAITTPMLIMHGAEDRITDLRGSALLYERASATDKTLKVWDGLYHEIHNEPAARDDVIALMGDWIEARLRA